MDSSPRSVTYQWQVHTPDEMRERAQRFHDSLRKRRSIREFSNEAIDLQTVRTCIASAAQAPSGANQQPWTFVLVTDPKLKQAIRAAAEAEERSFYGGRAPPAWLTALQALGTDWRKPFLEQAPALIVVFAHKHGPGGQRNYYVTESVGIALGFLIVALHNAGLATLPHTPSPMDFLGRILERPPHERAFALLPVGLPAPDCQVPAIERRPLQEVLIERLDPDSP